MTRRALVTGGSAGLGAAFVAELVALGYAVVSIDRDAPAGNLPSSQAVRADFAEPAALPQLVAGLEGPFDIVVLNAGISAVGAFEDIASEQLDRLIAVNLVAPMELTRLLITGQRLAVDASLIFVGSLSNRLGYPGASVYAAGKQGLEAFATSLRKAGPYGVLCVLPGPLDTGHASRYAPAGSARRKRQDPSGLARRVLQRRHRSGTVYGNVQQEWAGLLGLLAPSLVTGLMRRGLFTKLRAAPPVTDDRS